MRDRLQATVSAYIACLSNENQLILLLTVTEGRDLAKLFGCTFVETSAKRRVNVDEAFSELVREIRKYNRVSYLRAAGHNAY